MLLSELAIANELPYTMELSSLQIEFTQLFNPVPPSN